MPVAENWKWNLNFQRLLSEAGKCFVVGPTPGGSQCTRISPNLSWKWPCATLSPSLGHFFERSHSFWVKVVSGKFWKTLNNAPVHDIQLGKRKSAVPRSILPEEQVFFFLGGYHARGHNLNVFQTPPRKSGFFQRTGWKRVKEWRKVTFMKEWMKPLYIAYHQALDFPKTFSVTENGPFENFLRSNSIFI